MMKKILILLFIVSFNATAGLKSFLKKQQYFFQFDQSLSFTGINLGLLGGVEYKEFSLYFGPKFIISDTYLITDQVLSINSGLRYNILKSKKVRAYLNADFNLTLTEPYDRSESSNDKYNKLYEFYFGYGIDYLISKKVRIGNVMAYGKYIETFYNLSQDTEESFDGMTGMIKFYISYDL